MDVYLTKAKVIPGLNFRAVEKVALKVFKQVKSKSKRTPYVRSAYFKGEKVFLNIFWSHLYDKRLSDRVRRLKYFDCALEVMQNSTFEPQITENPNNKSELLYRFFGQPKGGQIFIVQIKENKKTRRKDFVSIFTEN